MKNQEAEMTEQRRTMQAQVKQMTEQVIKMQGQLDQMKSQETRMIEQRDLMRDALEETRRMFDISERPILVVDEVKAELIEGNIIKPVVTISNKGRTAATGLELSFNVGKPPILEHGFSMTGATKIGIDLLAAQDSHEIRIDSSDRGRALDHNTWSAVVEREAESLYVYGDGSDKDMSGKKSYPLPK